MAANSYLQQQGHHPNIRYTPMRRSAPQAPRKAAVLGDGSDVRHQSAPQPSRLEQMQARYQRNLHQEKERKLVALHQRAQDQLPRVEQPEKNNNAGKRGVVREFFKERRQLEKGQTAVRLPAPGTHLQQLRSEQEALQLQERRKQEELRHFAVKQRRDQPQKRRAGYSKNKLLDPIEQHTLTQLHPQKEAESSPMSNTGNRAVVTGTPHRKLPRVNMVRKPKPVKKAVMTDFQKWQLEQDQQRDARLRTHREMLGEDKEGRPFSGTFHDDEVSVVGADSKKHGRRDVKDKKRKELEETRRKERELEALIAKHQEELDNLQLNESNDDEDMEMSHESVHLPVGEEDARIHQDIEMPQEDTEVDRPTYHDENENKIEEPYRCARKEQNSSKRRVNGKRQTKQSVAIELLQASEEECSGEVDEGTNFYAQAVDNLAEDASYVDLRPCPNCGRKFAAQRLPKHVPICQKTSQTKRKVFDSTKHRAEGTEFAEYVKKGRHLKEPAKKPTSNWKKKHDEFVRTVRDAREVQAHVAKGGKLSDLPPPPPAEHPDYQQCPYCKRKFNPGAAERHIPHCKNAKSRPKPPPKQRTMRINYSTSRHKTGGL